MRNATDLPLVRSNGRAMAFVYSVPIWVAFVVIVGSSTAGAALIHLAIRRSFPIYDFVRHNEVGGFLVSAVAALYAVVLGFITIVVWQQYNDSDFRHRQEAGALATSYGLAGTLPNPLRVTLRAHLERYVDDMIAQEWPAMRTGGDSPAAATEIALAQTTIGSFRPANPGESNVQSELISQIDTVVDRRRMRLEDNQTGIGSLLWTALVTGAACVLGFSFLFGMDNFRVQLIMTSLITIVITVMFTVIVELDFPFRGQAGIAPVIWTTERDRLHRIDAMP